MQADKANQLVVLMSKLAGSPQGALGWIYSSTRNSVHYKNNPGATKEIQKEVDELVPGLLIVYLFALLETYLPSKEWKDYLDSDLISKLKAYKHIRHSYSHFTDGTRAMQNTDYAKEFDVVMQSANPLKGVELSEEGKLRLDSSAIFELLDIIDRSAKHVVVRSVGTGSTA